VLENRESGTMLKQQAVLFRASHHSGPLEVELTRRNIPFVKFGGLKFLDAAHIKDMLALLRFVENRGALRIWPVFVLGHRFSGLVAIQRYPRNTGAEDIGQRSCGDDAPGFGSVA
jgi:superfamily I DNA/RNA helicase